MHVLASPRTSGCLIYKNYVKYYEKVLLLACEQLVMPWPQAVSRAFLSESACSPAHADMASCARPACSSSFVALNDAVADLQRGRIDYAMVGGSSALFRPATTVAFHQLQCAPALRACPGRLSACWARSPCSA